MYSSWDRDHQHSKGIRQEYYGYRSVECAKFRNEPDFSSTLQDNGYHVYFVAHKVYIKHQSWKKVKQIGVRSNKFYKL